MEPALAVVVIVNWNGRQHLEKCLAALSEDLPGLTRVVVVDNGSSDGSAEWLSEHHPEVEVIRLSHNRGFAAGNNVGIAATQSRYVVTLNNDTRAQPGWLPALVETAESDPSIGLCASRILLADHPSLLDSAGIEVDSLGFAWQRGHGQPDGDEYGAPCDVFGPSAAAALYRRSMLDRIGSFDEDFGSYYEDVDLAWRARRAGWRCRYVPNALVEHAHSATGSRDPELKHRLVTRNRWWTMIKNYPIPQLWLMLPILAAADLVSLVRGLLIYRSMAPLRARIDAIRGVRWMWGKRRQVPGPRQGV